MSKPGLQEDLAMSEQTENPEESSWDFEEGDEIVPGRSALKRLGGGFRYEAYLSWDDRLRSLVVTKIVRPGLVEDGHTLEGLASEVSLLERLSHPVLVRGFAADLEGPRPHLVLEHLEGPRLSTLLRKYGPLMPEQLVPLALQLTAAIHYMAGEGVVHLDVKPSNIIMGGPPRLIDVSVARTLEQCKRLHSPVGTDAYMAPEQCLPDAGMPVGPAADVWGVGVTLYRALTGERPFSSGDRHSDVPVERWPQLAESPNGIDERFRREVADPILACLAYDPAERPTPGQVGDALETILAGLPGPKISKLKPRSH